MSIRLLGRAAAIVLICVLVSAPAPAQVPSLIAIWGGAADTQARLHDPSAIAVDPVTGNIFVGDFDGGRVVVLDRTGTFVRQWYTFGLGDRNYLSGPTGLLADGLGHVYVSDRNNNCVKKYTVDGTYLAQWGPNFEVGHPGRLNLPHGLALDANGLVYVADAWNNQVKVFTSDGAFVRAWGAYGSGPGQFMADYGIAVSRDGRVCVSDYDNCRVQGVNTILR